MGFSENRLLFSACRCRSDGRRRCGGPRKRRALGWASALVAACLSFPALADAPIEIGRTIFVAKDVQGRMGEEQPKRILVNDDVLYQEYILTADQAETIMEFRDGSTFEVGPGAVVRIDSFVFNPDEGISHKAVSVGRGVFRYISGLSAKEQDTKISTGNGVLAVRGSVVAGIVDPDVPDFVYVGEGSAVFSNNASSTELRPGHANRGAVTHDDYHTAGDNAARHRGAGAASDRAPAPTAGCVAKPPAAERDMAQACWRRQPIADRRAAAAASGTA